MDERRRAKQPLRRVVQDYAVITLAMIMGSVGWVLFTLPNHIPMGGISGIASIVYWGTGIPAQFVFFGLNFVLLAVALKILGWRFCIKTIYGVILFTLISTIVQNWMHNQGMLEDQKFMATIVGGVFLGLSVGLGLSAGGSTGGSDVIAAMVNKYRDVSLGRVILVCDLAIITSSYVVLRDWEDVLYGYVLLFVISFCVDYVVNGLKQSVQFFIISDKFEEIGNAINHIANRGCTAFAGTGFYSGSDIHMLFVIAKKNEAGIIFDLIDEIDPTAFVAESACMGVYGMGFDRFKVRHKDLVKTRAEINKLNQ